MGSRFSRRSAPALAVVVLTLSATLAPAVPAIPQTVVSNAAAKARGAAEVSLTAPRITRAGSVGVRAQVRALRGITGGTLAFDGNGVVVPSARSLSALHAGASRTFTISLAPQAARATLRATLTATRDGLPFGHRSTLFLLSDGGTVRAGTAGFASLELEALHDQRGALDAATFAAREASILDAPAHTTSSIVPGAPLAQATISGTIRWADSAGGLHPARNVRVDILDNTAAGIQIVKTVQADATGVYTWSGDNLRPTTDARRISVRAWAINPATTVGPTAGGTWQMTSAIQAAIPDGANVTIDLSANDPANKDGHAAFSVADAMITAQDYVQNVAGAAPAKIKTWFPVGGTVSYYDGADTSLNILQFDRFDWDVLHHEYGHYVSNKIYSLAFSPGGQHGLGENLADHVRPDGTKYGKDHGVRLAWGEGWPTYFGTSLQAVMGAGALAIPNVGDASYTDTEDYTPALAYNLESQGTKQSLGEDNELSTQRIVWDIYDASDDAGDQVTKGHKSVWNTLVKAKAKHISDVWKAFTEGKTHVDIDVARLGCIFSEHRVAPAPTAPADKAKAPDAAPQFTWNSNGGGPNGRNNKFFVEFYDAAFQSKLFTSPEITTAVTDNTGSWTPTDAQWTQILDAGTPVINWVVKGRQTSAPATGEYVGCRRRLIKPKTDLIFTIDVTGSMYDDIDAVKAAASDLVNAIDLAAQDYRVAVVSYRDFPVSPYGDPGDWTFQAVVPFTQNKPAILAGINSLAVGGGNDWPESVYSAMMGSIDATALGGWRNGVRKSIILMGDAPGHDPEPFTGYTIADVTLAAFLADPVQIYPVAIAGFDSTVYDQFRRMAEDSNGAYFFASNASQVVGQLRNAIERALVAPLGDAGPTYYTGRAGIPVQFDAGASFDVDGEITSYRWDWDGNGVIDEVTTVPLIEHTWATPYEGQVHLTVVDDDGYESADFAEVTIALADQTAPVSHIVAGHDAGAAPLAIPYVASDPIGSNGAEPTGVGQVELWYRHAPFLAVPETESLPPEDPTTLTQIGPFSPWSFTAIETTGAPMMFTPSEGAGVYELLTVAVDRADNREDPVAATARAVCIDGIDGPTCTMTAT